MYNQTVTNICKYQRKGNHYDVFLTNKNNVEFRNREQFENNNIDLYLLINEMKKMLCSNSSEDIVVKSLTYLYFFILFNYVNILIEHSTTDNCNMKNDTTLPTLSQTNGNNKDHDTYNNHAFYTSNPSDGKTEVKNGNDIVNITNDINFFVSENNVRLELQEIQNNIQNALSNNVELIFHFSSYLTFFVDDFVDILKKYNYFLYAYNSYHFAISLKCVYLLYENLREDLINEIYDKVIFVIKNNCYIDISKIIIIYIFTFFLNKKYVVKLCEKDISEFFPNISDSKDLALVKYYFILKFIHHKNITIRLLDIYNNLFKYYNYEIVQCSGKCMYTFSRRYHNSIVINRGKKKNAIDNSGNNKSGAIKGIFHNEEYSINEQATYCKKECMQCVYKDIYSNNINEENIRCIKQTTNCCHNVLSDVSLAHMCKSSCKETGFLTKYNMNTTFYSSNLMNGKGTENILGEKNLAYYIYNFLKKKKAKMGKYFNINKSLDLPVIIHDNDRLRTFSGKNAPNSFDSFYPFDHLLEEYSKNSEDDLPVLYSTENCIHLKKIYFLIFSYYVVKYYNRYFHIKTILRSMVCNVLPFNMNELNIIFLMLHFLYEKQEVALFCFLQNDILNTISKIRPKYKVINFLVFLFYLVKIKYANTKFITKILSNVLSIYKFSIKVYMVIIKIIKRIIQHHNIFVNYKYMIEILKSIKENNNQYLHNVSMYYINIIENKISFMEFDQFNMKSNNFCLDLPKVIEPIRNNSKNGENTLLGKFLTQSKHAELKYTGKYVKSNFIKLTFYKLDRKNSLYLDDNSCAIFYSQSDKMGENEKRKNEFILRKYYNYNDFNSKSFFSIYNDNTYHVKKYYNYIVNNDHNIYFPFILKYNHWTNKKKKKENIVSEEKRENIACEKKRINLTSEESKVIMTRGEKKMKKKKLFCLNIFFLHKADFVNMHNVYIPYIELGDKRSSNSNNRNNNDNYNVHMNRCSKKVNRTNHKSGHNNEQINMELLSLLRRAFRRRKVFTLKKNKFYISPYSYKLHKVKIKRIVNCLIRDITENKGKKQAFREHRHELNEEWNKFEINNINNTSETSKINGINKSSKINKTCKVNKMSKINKFNKKKRMNIHGTHFSNFVELKKDIVKKEIYKTTYKLKNSLFILREKNNIKKNNPSVNLCINKRTKCMNEYKILLKIGVNLLITTKFYAYIVYLNRKNKTFKRFLGKYNINFSDFFLPFKACTQYWKFIFEDVWNGKTGKMYKSAKYLNIISSKVLNIIHKKLQPFLINENPNIKNVYIYNPPKFNMHIQKNYCLNDKYYAYDINKYCRINSNIIDEFYIDNYSLCSSDTDIENNSNINKNKNKKCTTNTTATTTTTTSSNSNKVAIKKKEKRKYIHTYYKPKRLNGMFYISLTSSNNNDDVITNSKGKQNIAEKKEKKRENNKNESETTIYYNEQSSFVKQYMKYKFSLNVYNEIIGMKLKRNKNIRLTSSNSAKYKLNEKMLTKNIYSKCKKNYYLMSKGEKKSQKSKHISINYDVINKFVGIFLPPKHHLLMVFHIYEKSTMIQIRTDNLNTSHDTLISFLPPS
ncbi:conserved Plasmodium protein, unknown function [Plasmodium malariae]|uniref:Adaptor-related protein complex 5 beta subunit n=1 Tax=Plasmodium malariae TaxID=5858 RepID=A0A1C3L2T0_PLAMA|nr:conserved Plasmodium protein, unknown function [Plasmodium malariae]